MNKEDMVHICNDTSAKKKKEWNNAIFSNKDLEMITVIQENQ